MYVELLSSDCVFFVGTVSLTFTTRSHTQGLTNGGRSGLFWSYVWTVIGFGFVMFSLAEMSSMSVAILALLARWSRNLNLFPMTGHRYLVDSITGCLNSDLHVTRNF